MNSLSLRNALPFAVTSLALLASTSDAAAQTDAVADPVPKAYAHVGPGAFELQIEIEAALNTKGAELETKDLLHRLGQLPEAAPSLPPAILSLAQATPFALPAAAEFMGAELARLAKSDPLGLLPELGTGIASIADWDAPTTLDWGAPVPPNDSTLEQHFAWLEARLVLAASCVEEGLADLSAGDRAHVAEHWSELTDRFEGNISLDNDSNAARLGRNLRTVEIGSRVNPAPMLRAIDAFQPCLDPDYLEDLGEAAYKAKHDIWAETVATHQTPLGLIVIGGKLDDVHRFGTHGEDSGPDGVVALWIDLGGDDFYGGSVGTTVNQAGRPVIPVGVVIDLDGNDAYEAAQDGSIGAGVLGLGMVIDVKGNDSYIGRRWSQGVGFMGVGLVIDGEGDDRYRARSLAQGAAAWGVGGVFDRYGADRFTAERFAQGVGLPGGVGLLGNAWDGDEYYCKGEWPSGYGTAGVFEGWGQGCGVGFRGIASGGIGLLSDGAGRDRYEGGNFSQGGGYYYGFGALFDRGTRGDDYIGSRYNQGFSAHQAAGYFHEFGGDDSYRTRFAVAPALAWDECVTFFRDDKGDDLYQGGAFSMGASAHNSLAVFWDLGGEDEYRWRGLAEADKNEYHGGTSLAYFLDAGGDRDSYAGDQKNDSTSTSSANGFFVDR
ncbi:MAG: hypothetical protein ACJAVJ_001313 [Planctomycetota bacterium]|jgi:hypothetical protein